MGLAAYAINGNALGEPLVNLFNHTPGYFSIVGDVKVVVVDIELGSGVSCTCCAEGNAYKVLAENATEDAVAEGAILGEDLIDDVPLDDLAPIAGDHGGDVVLDDRSQGGAIVDGAYPRRQLRVPEEGVAADELAVGLGEVYNGVSVREAE